MNFIRREHPVPVDLDKLREELGPMPTDTGQAVDFAPREAREKKPYSDLQLIAHAITKLPYRDAVTMGDAIQKFLSNEPSGSPQNVTAAIQGWADGWENFPPTSS